MEECGWLCNCQDVCSSIGEFQSAAVCLLRALTYGWTRLDDVMIVLGRPGHLKGVLISAGNSRPLELQVDFRACLFAEKLRAIRQNKHILRVTTLDLEGSAQPVLHVWHRHTCLIFRAYQPITLAIIVHFNLQVLECVTIYLSGAIKSWYKQLSTPCQQLG